jgi:hypothetical protein
MALLDVYFTVILAFQAHHLTYLDPGIRSHRLTERAFQTQIHSKNYMSLHRMAESKPLYALNEEFNDQDLNNIGESSTNSDINLNTLASIASICILSLMPIITHAAEPSLTEIFDPSKFQPVCPGSDTVYQLLKLSANGLVGSDNVVEYGPLIASVLLRVRLELCVLESFLYEAVVPFIQQKGISWVLPLHETIESFLAGTIFALASNFILLGSTKIISVLIIYVDALTGLPARLLGSGLKKISKENSVTSTIGSILKGYGDVMSGSRKFSEAADTFVGRYLVILTSFYIVFKFLHFKVFNDIFP